VLPDWIRRVMQYRQSRKNPQSDAIGQGLRESLACGATSIGDIATSGWETIGLPVPDTTLFWEAIALTEQRVEQCMRQAEEHLDRAPKTDSLRSGLSPHAPYSIRLELVERLMDLAKKFRAPVAMHLAESREELDLLDRGEGPFRELLVELGVWDESAIHVGGRPLDFLQVLAKAPRALVIHGNYLDEEERRFVGEHAQRMSVVHCPRTHFYFRHEPYPLAGMLSAGVNVAIGTDSRASNPNLNMLEELHFMARQHTAVRLSKILELGTLGGARALGISKQVGTLEAGKYANLAVVRLPEETASNPHELLFDPAASVAQSWWRGRPQAPLGI
jgi:cytosine/adenosine deaminase-related metal-dependent hydrolase